MKKTNFQKNLVPYYLILLIQLEILERKVKCNRDLFHQHIWCREVSSCLHMRFGGTPCPRFRYYTEPGESQNASSKIAISANNILLLTALRRDGNLSGIPRKHPIGLESNIK